MEPLQHEILLALFDDDEEEAALTTTAYEAAIVAALRHRRPRACGGSRPGKRPNLQRDHRGGHKRIMKDYFIERPVFTDVHFRRCFRMSRSVFARILERVQVQDVYFVQKPDTAGRQGLCYPEMYGGTSADGVRNAGRCVRRVCEDCRDNCAGVLEAFLRRSDQCFWRRVLTSTNECGSSAFNGRQRSERVSRHVGQSWLHPLVMEELSEGVGQPVRRQREGADDRA